MIWALIKKEENEKRQAEKRKKQELLRKEVEKEEEQYALAHLFGLEKYAQLERMEDAKAREGIAAVKTLGAMMQESAIRGQKAEKDWAVLGGIANGIAGPIAGVATAVDTMQENAKIRAGNADLLQEGLRANIQYQQMARSAEANLPSLSSMAELNSRFDVVTSWSPDTLHSFVLII